MGGCIFHLKCAARIGRWELLLVDAGGEGDVEGLAGMTGIKGHVDTLTSCGGRQNLHTITEVSVGRWEDLFRVLFLGCLSSFSIVRI